MRIVYYFTYLMAFVFIVGESMRRGLEYLSINTTTMLEDYFAGLFLLCAAICWRGKYKSAPMVMAAAWGYASGGMFVPFFAHIESWLRGATVRFDHPHTDIESIIAKGIIWLICLVCLLVTLRHGQKEKL